MEGMDGVHYWSNQGLQGMRTKTKDTSYNYLLEETDINSDKQLIESLSHKSDQIQQVKIQIQKFSSDLKDISNRLEQANNYIGEFDIAQSKSVESLSNPILVRKQKERKS